MRRPFEDPTPAFGSGHSRTGENRFGAREERTADANERLLGLLRGSEEEPPLTHRGAAERLSLSAKKLHKRVETLKKLGVRLRSGADQKLVASVFRGVRMKPTRDGRAIQVPSDLSFNRSVEIPIAEALVMTGYTVEQLESYGCKRFTRRWIDRPETVEMLLVPPELILKPANELPPS